MLIDNGPWCSNANVRKSAPLQEAASVPNLLLGGAMQHNTRSSTQELSVPVLLFQGPAQEVVTKSPAPPHGGWARSLRVHRWWYLGHNLLRRLYASVQKCQHNLTNLQDKSCTPYVEGISSEVRQERGCVGFRHLAEP